MLVGEHIFSNLKHAMLAISVCVHSALLVRILSLPSLASHVGVDPAPGFLEPPPLDVECTLHSQVAGQKLHVLYYISAFPCHSGAVAIGQHSSILTDPANWSKPNLSCDLLEPAVGLDPHFLSWILQSVQAVLQC
jgi:hypothetical protein